MSYVALFQNMISLRCLSRVCSIKPFLELPQFAQPKDKLANFKVTRHVCLLVFVCSWQRTTMTLD